MRTTTYSFVLPLLLLTGLALPQTLQACDTFAAMPDATSDGIVMLGKNSDRPMFDCQPLVYHPRAEWAAGSEIDLGRVSVPQVSETYATIGSSPYWCWGYEEGMNEFGVAIGNEGVMTRPLVESILASESGQAPQPGPTGMDLIRLGLERSRTAREALDVITDLLETFGQFGSGLPTQGVAGAYENSFIIADPDEAWILETAGTRWAARRIESGVASISNTLSIGTRWDLASDDLIEHAVEKGWWQDGAATAFDFAAVYSSDIPAAAERMEGARVRQERSCGLLEERLGEVDTGWMKRVARDRTSEPAIDLAQTASSCVATLPALDDGIPVFWWCAGRPSVGCYVPFFVHADRLPGIVSTAGTHGRRTVAPSEAVADSFSTGSYWWLSRDLADKVAADWDNRYPIVREEFDRLEASFDSALGEVLGRAHSLRQAGDTSGAADLLHAYTASCVEAVVAKVSELREQFGAEIVPVPARYKPYVGTYVGNFADFKDAAFEVKVQNGHLAVDVPGQMVFEMKDPDDQGRWYFALTDQVAVTFADDGAGGITSMQFHQTAQIPRKEAGEDVSPETAPEEYRSYVGRYMIAPGVGEVEVLVAGGGLELHMSGDRTVRLNQPDAEGRRYFENDPMASVSFERDEAGDVSGINIHQTFELPRAD